MLRFVYHVRKIEPDVERYEPSSLRTEGFVHCSYAPAVRDSIALYFAGQTELEVLQIDPRRLDVPIHVARTPRGPMPHVHGAIPRLAITARWSLVTLPALLPDEV